MDISRKNRIKKIVCCYAHEDQEYVEKLDKHLTLLQRLNSITFWTDKDIHPGTEWERELAARLDEAQVILLFISASFLASDYCYGKGIQKAMTRHERGEVCVIPIMVRPVVWQDAPFGKLQALPKDAKPITLWRNEDEALMTIAEGVYQIVDLLASMPSSQDATISLPLPYPRLRHSPAPAGQEEVPTVLSPEEVWERIQRKDVPSTWHILGASRFSDDAILAICLTIVGGFCGLMGALIILSLGT